MTPRELLSLVTPCVRAQIENLARFEQDRLTWGNTMESKLPPADFGLVKSGHQERLAFYRAILDLTAPKPSVPEAAPLVLS